MSGSDKSNDIRKPFVCIWYFKVFGLIHAEQKHIAKNRKYRYCYAIINNVFYFWKDDNILCRFHPVLHVIYGLGLYVWYIDVCITV
jgi:hypothetical protein